MLGIEGRTLSDSGTLSLRVSSVHGNNLLVIKKVTSCANQWALHHYLHGGEGRRCFARNIPVNMILISYFRA